MLRRCYLPACVLLMAVFIGFLIWIIIAIMSKSADYYVDVLISVACLCVSFLFLFALFLHYLVHRTSSIVPFTSAYGNEDPRMQQRNVLLPSLVTVRSPAKMKNVVVDVDCETMHIHVAESQTSPQALAIAFYSALDEPPTYAIVDA